VILVPIIVKIVWIVQIAIAYIRSRAFSWFGDLSNCNSLALQPCTFIVDTRDKLCYFNYICSEGCRIRPRGNWFSSTTDWTRAGPPHIPIWTMSTVLLVRGSFWRRKSLPFLGPCCVRGASAGVPKVGRVCRAAPTYLEIRKFFAIPHICFKDCVIWFWDTILCFRPQIGSCSGKQLPRSRRYRALP
jgi:hypothetical protein